jgi:hypothetical protein
MTEKRFHDPSSADRGLMLERRPVAKLALASPSGRRLGRWPLLAAKLALVAGAGPRRFRYWCGELGLALKDVLCCSIRLSLAGSPYPVTAPRPLTPGPAPRSPDVRSREAGPLARRRPAGRGARGPYMWRDEHQRHERRQRNRTRYLMLNPKRSSVRRTVEGRSTWAVQYMPH